MALAAVSLVRQGLDGIPGLFLQRFFSLGLGVIFAWLVLWLVAAVREFLHYPDPARWPLSGSGDGEVLNSDVVAHLFSVVTPFIVLGFVQGIWSPESEVLGWISLGGGAIYTLAALCFRYLGDRSRISYTQALTALLLLTLGLVLVPSWAPGASS